MAPVVVKSQSPFSLAREWRYPALTAALFLVSVLLIHPVLEAGVIDDWSFVYLARGLAIDGHLVYNGWGEPTMIPQALWGALFFKLFGFSFLVARISTVVLCLLLVPVLYALGREVGLKPAFANFAVLLLVLCPVFVPEAVSFMTDVPSFFFTAACLYAALRAAKASDMRTCAWWGVGATVFGILAGATRQLCWAAPLWMLLAAAWVQRRNRAALALAACWPAAAVACAGTLLWFYRQDFVPRLNAPIPFKLPFTRGQGSLYLAESLVILLLPAAVMFVGISQRLFPSRPWAAVSVITWVAALIYEYNPENLPPRLRDTIDQFGFTFFGLVKSRPVVLSPPARMALGVGAVFCAAAMIAVMLRIVPCLACDRNLRLFLWLAVPYAMAVMAGSVWHGGIYDRYLIQVLPLVAIPVLWICQLDLNGAGMVSETVRAPAIPVFSWILLAVYAAFGIAITHDAFALRRATIQAAEALASSGVERREIMAGLEYDAWTQLTLTGYVNEPRVAKPAFAYRPVTNCRDSLGVNAWYRPWVPDLRPRYFIGEDLSSLTPSLNPQVVYHGWLPPADRFVSTYTLPDGGALDCQ
jgi:4-amino-4-deoxy-L-arabinose transferase-like glycosyltransferase